MTLQVGDSRGRASGCRCGVQESGFGIWGPATQHVNEQRALRCLLPLKSGGIEFDAFLRGGRVTLGLGGAGCQKASRRRALRNHHESFAPLRRHIEGLRQVRCTKRVNKPKSGLGFRGQGVGVHEWVLLIVSTLFKLSPAYTPA